MPYREPMRNVPRRFTSGERRSGADSGMARKHCSRNFQTPCLRRLASNTRAHGTRSEILVDAEVSVNEDGFEQVERLVQQHGEVWHRRIVRLFPRIVQGTV